LHPALGTTLDWHADVSQFPVMSAQEIIAELPKLKPDQLQLFKARLETVMAADAGFQKPPSSGAKEDLAQFLLGWQEQQRAFRRTWLRITTTICTERLGDEGGFRRRGLLAGPGESR
jgi:hypothetical protein